MYPLVTLGPVRLSTYGLGLLVAAFVWWTWSERRTTAAGYTLPEWLFPATIAAAWCGGRLGALQYDTGAMDAVAQLFTIRVFEYTWWSAALAATALFGWGCRRSGQVFAPVVAVIAVPTLLAIGLVSAAASIGGATLGTASALPWAVAVFGVTRHLAGVYSAVLLGVGAAAIHWRRGSAGWTLWATIGLLALNELLCAGFRSDSWQLPGGIHPEQLAALVVLLVAQERVMMLARVTE